MVPKEELEVQHLLVSQLGYNQPMDHKHKIKRELILVLKAPKGELVVVRLLDLLQFHIPTQKWLIAVLKLILGSMFPMEELVVELLLDYCQVFHNRPMGLRLKQS